MKMVRDLDLWVRVDVETETSEMDGTILVDVEYSEWWLDDDTEVESSEGWLDDEDDNEVESETLVRLETEWSESDDEKELELWGGGEDAADDDDEEELVVIFEESDGAGDELLGGDDEGDAKDLEAFVL